ncbi:vascular endothelial growth factor receptor 3-like isoform X2 [Oratosquilla oratoria]|uniref:vascular endothelial growth factor receptor 3-like isoform X2 n=1 Tax=Oratosquilla oratoria TaxID=337810 RepID=UPI003F770FF7
MKTTFCLLIALATLTTTKARVIELSAHGSLQFKNNSNVSPGEPKEVLLKKNVTSFEIRCSLQGDSRPIIEWFKEGKPIHIQDSWFHHFSDDEQILRLEPLSFYALGKYTCTAWTTSSWISGSLHLNSENYQGPLIASGWAWILLLVSVVVGFTVAVIYVKMNPGVSSHQYIMRIIVDKFFTGQPKLTKSYMSPVTQIEMLPYIESCEIGRSRITLGSQIAKGTFGPIHKAQVSSHRSQDKVLDVVAKIYDKAQRSGEIRTLERELKTLSYVGRHLNIVNLVGANTFNLSTDGEIWVLLEYCRYGNLLAFIQNNRNNFVGQQKDSGPLTCSPANSNINMKGDSPLHNEAPLESASGEGISSAPCSSESTWKSESYTEATEAWSSTQEDHQAEGGGGGGGGGGEGAPIPGITVPFNTTDLVCWAWQIAKAMDFLTQRNVYHGGLALENIYLSRGNIVKVANFGFYHPHYSDRFYKKKIDIPILRWMSLEGIQDLSFSTQGDIWSFGVILWELFSLGETPYPDIECINRKFYKELDKGYRMEKPQYASDDIYDIMTECWCDSPFRRPEFVYLAEKFAQMLPPQLTRAYVDLNDCHEKHNKRMFENQTDPLMAMAAPIYTVLDDSAFVRPYIEEDVNYLDIGAVYVASDVEFQPRKREEQGQTQAEDTRDRNEQGQTQAEDTRDRNEQGQSQAEDTRDRNEQGQSQAEDTRDRNEQGHPQAEDTGDRKEQGQPQAEDTSDRAALLK